ncbi:sulfite reductase, partial [Achromatium sp. WMS2]
MAIEKHNTPMLDQLEHGPWPSFISGIKRLRDEHPSERINKVTNDLLGQLEHSYETRKGYWKGGTVSVFGYGGGIIPRFSEVGKAFPESKEFHTIRVQPPAGNHYTTAMLRQLADSWEKHGSGLVTFHGQTGNIMFIGADTESTQHFFDEINDYGWDLGGAGPCVRTGMSCVGAARCEMSCTNEHKAHRLLLNNFTDDVHRPALPYKFKFKISGCPNDCQNAIERADFAVIGTWRDDMKVDQEEVKKYIADKGRQYYIDNVVTRCPTKAVTLRDDDTLE